MTVAENIVRQNDLRYWNTYSRNLKKFFEESKRDLTVGDYFKIEKELEAVSNKIKSLRL